MPTVLEDTGIICNAHDPAHAGVVTELVPQSTQEARVKVRVVSGTGVLFNAFDPIHVKAGSEWITRDAQLRRVDQVCVVNKTGILFDQDNPEHVKAGSRWITRRAQLARKKRAAEKLRDKVAASATHDKGGVSTTVGVIANTAAVSSRHAVGIFATRGADALPGSKRSRPPNVANISGARPSQRSRLLAADELASVSGASDKASGGTAATRSTTADNSQSSQGPVAVEAGATTSASTSVSTTVDAGNPVPACESPALGGGSGLRHSPAFFVHSPGLTVAPAAGCGSSVFEFDFVNELDGDKAGSPYASDYADLFEVVSP